MGWRTSVYSLDKDEKFIVFDEENFGDINDKAKEWFYDYCTDLWLDMKMEPEFKKHIKCVRNDEDRDFYSIDKEGWVMFMNGIKQKHINVLENLVKDKEQRTLHNARTYEDYVNDEIYYWKTSFKEQDESITEDYGMYFDYRKDSNKISGGITWMSAFYDALFLYKTLDWDKQTLYIVGY